MKTSLLILLAVLTLLLNPGAAAAQPNDCDEDDVQDWLEESTALLQGYESSAENLESPAQLLEFLELLEDFDDEDAPGCAWEAKAMLIRMMTLKTTAAVALMAGNADDAEELSEDAEQAKEDAIELLDDLGAGDEAASAAPVDTSAIASISAPGDGESVSEQIVVEGSYDPAALGENSLWVVVLAPSGMFYPQIVNGCAEGEQQSVLLGPAPTAWQVTSFIGGAGEFNIILYLADPDETAAMFELFLDDWCPDNFPGLTQAQFNEYGFDYITDVSVTR